MVVPAASVLRRRSRMRREGRAFAGRDLGGIRGVRWRGRAPPSGTGRSLPLRWCAPDRSQLHGDREHRSDGTHERDVRERLASRRQDRVHVAVGCLGIAIMNLAESLGAGLSSFVSIGNKADVSGNDLLSYWGDDERTDVILLYLESFGNPRRFAALCRDIARRKPIVVVKSGRGTSGHQGDGLHTGALLAASDTTVEALFRQHGVIRTDTLEEMFDVATLLASQPVPRRSAGRDRDERGGPRHPMRGRVRGGRAGVAGALSTTTLERLRAHLPAEAAVGNRSTSWRPLGVPTTRRRSQRSRPIPRWTPDRDLHPTAGARRARGRHHLVEAIGAIDRPIPVLTCFMSARGVPDELRAQGHRIPSFAFPEQAAIALAHAWRPRRVASSTAVLAAGVRRPAHGRGGRSSRDGTRARRGMARPGGGAVTAHLLRDLDRGTTRGEGSGGGGAGSQRDRWFGGAEDDGCASQDRDGSCAASTSRRNRSRMKRVRWRARANGPHGSRGLHRAADDRGRGRDARRDRADPQFGPVVACGAGGTTVELVNDVQVGVAPLTRPRRGRHGSEADHLPSPHWVPWCIPEGCRRPGRRDPAGRLHGGSPRGDHRDGLQPCDGDGTRRCRGGRSGPRPFPRPAHAVSGSPWLTPPTSCQAWDSIRSSRS